jgi:hypothetical protein
MEMPQAIIIERKAEFSPKKLTYAALMLYGKKQGFVSRKGGWCYILQVRVNTLEISPFCGNLFWRNNVAKGRLKPIKPFI